MAQPAHTGAAKQDHCDPSDGTQCNISTTSLHRKRAQLNPHRDPCKFNAVSILTLPSKQALHDHYGSTLNSRSKNHVARLANCSTGDLLWTQFLDVALM
jgi:hypothetical protein